MRFTSLIGTMLILGGAAAAVGAPVITPGGIVSAASLTVGGGIAQGSYFTIQGTSLGPASGLLAPTASSTNPYPTELPANGGTSVTIHAAGVNYSAFITYTSSTQVYAILPSKVPAGPATLTVTYNGATSQSQSITISSEQFNVFAENGEGWGQAVAQHSANGEQPVNNIANAAAPGATVILYGTGLGALPSGVADNLPPPSSPQVNFLKAPYNYTVSVKIGGQSIAASFAGRTPSPGLDQINFQLPAAMTTGCFVRGEVVVSPAVATASTTSNAFTLAVANTGEACPNAFGLTQTGLTKLQEGGTVNLGIGFFQSTDSLSSSTSPADEPKSDATVIFATANKPAVAGLNSLFAFVFTAVAGQVVDPSLLPPTGQCSAYDLATFAPLPPNGLQTLEQLGLLNAASTSIGQLFPGATLAALPAGSELTLSGPGGLIALTPSGVGGVDASTYSAKVANGLFASGGTWSLAGPGASGGVGPFSQPFTMPAALVWTNPPANDTVPLNQNLLMKWTGGGGGQITIAGGAIISGLEGGAFVCASAHGGQFSVPEAVLQSLTSVSSGAEASIAITSSGSVQMQDVSGLDGGALLFTGGTRMDATYAAQQLVGALLRARGGTLQ